MEVGYQDASFFGRLFLCKVALTPAHYRRRFGALNEQFAPGRGRLNPSARCCCGVAAALSSDCCPGRRDSLVHPCYQPRVLPRG